MTIVQTLLVAALLQAQSAPGEIRGTILGERDGGARPLAYAIVEVVGPAGLRTVLADSAGRYAVSGVPPGFQRVRAIHLGHQEARLEVLVPPGDAVTLDLTLTPKPVELPELLVKAPPLPLPEVPGATAPAGREGARAEIALRALEASPGLTEAGLGEAIGRLPGNDPSDPSDVLFMRGSTTDLKLVLLDGAPVYTPFHLGGLLRTFDAEVLGSATHHVGGAPARYDGGLSYILDLRTRPPARDRFRLAGGVDLMSAATTLEGPLGERSGLLLSSRALHGMQSRLAGGRTSPYGYLDGLLRGEVDLGPGHGLSLTAFGNDESVRLSLPPREDDPAPETLVGTPRVPDAAWGNTALSVSYTGEWARTGLELTASASRYRADLPLPLEDGSPDPAGGADQPARAILARGETDRARLAADAVRFVGSGALRAGGSVDHLRLSYGARHLARAPGEPEDFSALARGTVLGGYLDLLQRIAPDLYLRSGARVDHFTPGGARGALRLALLWNLTEDALLTVAGGRYHQLSRIADAQVELAVGDLMTAGTGGRTAGLGQLPLLSVASADHVVLSLDQRLAPAVRLTTEGFYKRFTGLGGLGSADLNASGLDLRVLREGERLTGWLGYSLSWFWDSPDAMGRADEFTGRHLLSVGFQGRVTGRWSVDLSLAYSDGLPLTSIPFTDAAGAVSEGFDRATLSAASESTGPLAGRTSDAFLRVDAEVSADLEPVVGGRTAHLRPYLRVLNALDRRDALFYYFEPWRDPDLRPLAELSVIPVLGLEWRF